MPGSTLRGVDRRTVTVCPGRKPQSLLTTPPPIPAAHDDIGNAAETVPGNPPVNGLYNPICVPLDTAS